MLLSFSVGNYLSFNKSQKLDLNPEALKEHKEHLHIPYHYDGSMRLLKSTAIFGHNSHGKSNFLKAYTFFRQTIFTSFKFGEVDSRIDVDYFKLNPANADIPSTFEIVFLLKNVKYRYRFEILHGKVFTEELAYAQLGIRENFLFERERDKITVSKTWSKDTPAITQSLIFTLPHNLFLSVLLSQKEIPKVYEIGAWLRGNQIITDTIDETHLKKSVMILSQPNYRAIIQRFLNVADIGFTTITEKIDSHTKNKLGIDKDFLEVLFSHELKTFEIYTHHDVYDNAREKVDQKLFELLKSESAGSIKFLILVCYLTLAIKEGQLIWIDELDSKMHVFLLHSIIKTFNDKKNNIVGSQMIFSLHNTSVLDTKLLRRDQINVVEKNEWGESFLQKMHTSSNPLRKEIQLEKKYLNGDLKGVSKKLKDGFQGHDLFS
jgi:AAA15 family ATPase/GTPase